MIGDIDSDCCILQSLSANHPSFRTQLGVQEHFGLRAHKKVLLVVSVTNAPVVRLFVDNH